MVVNVLKKELGALISKGFTQTFKEIYSRTLRGQPARKVQWQLMLQQQQWLQLLLQDCPCLSHLVCLFCHQFEVRLMSAELVSLLAFSALAC